MKRPVALAAVSALILVGCGSSSGGGGTDPLASGSDTGASGTSACGAGEPNPSYSVTMSSDPDPPRAEGTTFHLTVRRDGKPVTGAKVCLIADMPDMQHAGLSRVAKEVSGGTYDAEFKLGMGGPWAASVIVAEPGQPTVSLPVRFFAQE